MATGASNADLAIVLVDARKGFARRRGHHTIDRVGPRRSATSYYTINKIDLVEFDQALFRDIVIAYRKFAEPLGFRSLLAIPISARFGDNISSVSLKTPWVLGGHLLQRLRKHTEVEEEPTKRPISPAGAMDQPSASRFPRLRRTMQAARAARGEPIVIAGIGEAIEGEVPSSSLTRRRTCRSGRRGDADAGRRGRCRLRRRACAPGEPRAGGR